MDIIYKPAKKETENTECFFSTRINMAYRSTFNKNEKFRHGTAFSVISVLVTTEEKINSIDISKTAQVDWVTYTILTCRIC